MAKAPSGMSVRKVTSTKDNSLGTAPLSNSWIMTIIWLCIALNRTPNIDCYWGGGNT